MWETLGILTLVYVIVVPIEHYFGKEAVPVRERIFNYAAAAFYLVPGTYAAGLLTTFYPTIHIGKSPVGNNFLYVILMLGLADLLFYFYHRLQQFLPLLSVR